MDTRVVLITFKAHSLVMVLQVQGHTWARFCCLNVTHLLDLNRNKFSTDGSTQIVQTCLNGANANKKSFAGLVPLH